ncbi:glutaredoxin family protein [Noviherbaspirillum cavernae]|uniref:Glutaredoxin family protein n=1 Tax=Noviherbaspirillum cavernae TaxID=2320862 RepID=A0A418WZX8_9BURK|nr:glutaredoxin family protein [Noviherbaspirillum cavernae]RJG05800.1 glutaredoxin family protein [Noviherbaspirillum cavernae]
MRLVAFSLSTLTKSTLVHFTLYSRSYCHLCDDMIEALQALRSEYPFALEIVDVDADDGLVAQFDELVPVLVGSKDNATTVQLCNYFLDEAKVRDFLGAP